LALHLIKQLESKILLSSPLTSDDGCLVCDYVWRNPLALHFIKQLESIGPSCLTLLMLICFGLPSVSPNFAILTFSRAFAFGRLCCVL
jgi:hypothetical protein